MPQPAIAAQRQISIRDRMRRAPVLNIIGIPELIGLAGAALLAFLAVFAYFYFYVPAKSRLSSTELERQRLQGQRQAFGTTLQENLSTREAVDKLKESLDSFENDSLTNPSAGRMSLYTVLNNLIRSNSLRNTAGPSYSPLEPAGAKTQIQPSATAEKQSTAKWQSIYPGVVVSVTVEGPYQNVRHFIHDIEASRQFLIINAVELERVKQSGAVPEDTLRTAPAARSRATAPSTAAPPVAGSKGTLVSLRMDMTTYFRRPESKPAE